MCDETSKVAESVGGVKAELYFAGLEERVRLDKEITSLREEVEQVSRDRYDSQKKVEKVVAAMRAGGQPTLGSTGEGVSKWADLLDAAFTKEGEEDADAGDGRQGTREGAALDREAARGD